MLEDAQGLDVTTDSPEAIAALNGFVDQALSYGNDAEARILEGIAADPTCAIAHACAAAYYLSQENGAAWKQAVPFLQSAQRYAKRATERERLYIAAITAWAEGAIDRAIALHETIAKQYPRDILSVQQGQYHYFYQGNQERLLQIAEQVLPANRENPYLYGMVAFGLEQCYRLPEAEAMGRQATAMKRHNPWAHHAVAHVLESEGRVDEGIAWMEGLADTWKQCNTMLYTHNWWHVGLYYLAKGDLQTVLSLYDTHIWGRACKESPKDQVGAIATLLRLELSGLNIEDRWQELASYLSPRLHEHALPFQDLHYLYALARAGNQFELAEMLVSMQAHASAPNLCVNWLDVVMPAAYGLVAHAKGDWSTATSLLKPVLPRLWAIGGSHTQRQLFDQLYRDALSRDEQWQANVLQHRRQRRVA
ncbi:MAG: tetratricopeptide repeat protein [Leptolyngbya sp. BL-A-14]